jgi:hypothetical protein
MKELSIDLETLGTLVDSQILSIGLAMFNKNTGKIGNTLYLPIYIDNDWQINATIGTIKFWTQQAVNNPEALKGLFNYKQDSDSIMLPDALVDIQVFVEANKPDTVWANGTKFDLGMLERQFQLNDIKIPWNHNSDRCMRTLRQFAGNIEVDYKGVSHNALDDAIWQAKYISAAITKLFN